MAETVKQTPSSILEPGTQIGRYELIRRIEVGGMAEIYLARVRGISGFEKHVVLKRILPHHAARRDFVAMFLDEARIAALLHHPNIAQVYDIGADDGGSYFIAMEYVAGKDLRHIRKALRRQRRALPLEHALGIVLGTAAGLHSAHEKRLPDGRPLRIVHRDVSPANIIVSFDGCVKLIDFGIAKAAERETETRAGVLKGKSAFMSPEQCLGESLDRRSDVFSLGILLYELTTGLPLFRGKTSYETMSQIANGAVPRPSTRVSGYPARLEQIVMRALRRRPGDRYQTAQDLFVDLEAFALAEQIPVSQVGLAHFVQGLFPEGQPDVDPAAAGETLRMRARRAAPVLRAVSELHARTDITELTPPERFASAREHLPPGVVELPRVYSLSGDLDGAVTPTEGEMYTGELDPPTIERQPDTGVRNARRPSSTQDLDSMDLVEMDGGGAQLVLYQGSRVLEEDHALDAEALTSVVGQKLLTGKRAHPHRRYVAGAIGFASAVALAAGLWILRPAGADRAPALGITGGGAPPAPSVEPGPVPGQRRAAPLPTPAVVVEAEDPSAEAIDSERAVAEREAAERAAAERDAERAEREAAEAAEAERAERAAEAARERRERRERASAEAAAADRAATVDGRPSSTDARPTDDGAAPARVSKPRAPAERDAPEVPEPASPGEQTPEPAEDVEDDDAVPSESGPAAPEDARRPRAPAVRSASRDSDEPPEELLIEEGVGD